MAQDPQVWLDALDAEGSNPNLSDARKAAIAAERKRIAGDVPTVETADAAPALEDTAAPKPRRRRG